MKKLCALLFILIFAVYTQAQDTSSAEAGEVKSVDQKNSQGLKSGGKFNLPPEKANPVKVAKFVAPPVIDGKLDDEAWKSAQTLKDFIQTGPGDNVAPSKPTEVMLGYDEKKFLYCVSLFR